MKKMFMFAALATALFSCSSNKSDKDDTAVINDTIDVQEYVIDVTQPTWRLASYPRQNKTVTMDSTKNVTLNLVDSVNFSMQTDCNIINGTYALNGDSITFTPGIMTSMSCPDTTVQDDMLGMLQSVSTYRILPDSTLQLMSDTTAVATFQIML